MPSSRPIPTPSLPAWKNWSETCRNCEKVSGRRAAAFAHGPGIPHDGLASASQRTNISITLALAPRTFADWLRACGRLGGQNMVSTPLSTPTLTSFFLTPGYFRLDQELVVSLADINASSFHYSSRFPHQGRVHHSAVPYGVPLSWRVLWVGGRRPLCHGWRRDHR